MAHVNKKPLARKENWFKQKTWTRMNYEGIGKQLEKNAIQIVEEMVKNQSEITACEQQTTSKKANFCSNTVFSLYFKIRAQNFHAAKPIDFSLRFLLRCDQNHYSNLTSKLMKMCEQILKKRERPNTIQIL